MSSSKTQRLVDWYSSKGRPILAKTETAESMEDLEKQVARIEGLDGKFDTLFPICLLGQAGVGKSTLINVLIADGKIVVPSGGGTGPLTASALRVVYGEVPSFCVRYHKKIRLDQTRFILESEIRRQGKLVAVEQEVELEDVPGIREADLELDSPEDKKSRTENAIGRASLLVTAAQTATRETTYLADALRWILGQEAKYSTQIREDDMKRMIQVRDALEYSKQGRERKFTQTENADFGQRLRDHACEFLAPLIDEMSIQWPSPILRDSLELVDLPGTGILNDSHESVTVDYLRNKAKAVMLVVDSRGIRREDAEFLRTSGFLNRFLYSSDDPNSDPAALIVAVVRIDDVAVENWRNDKDRNNGMATKSKHQHFADVVDRCRRDIAQRLSDHLKEVWLDVGENTPGKQDVLKKILSGLKVIPVSAPQYRLHRSGDPDEEKPFLQSADETNIPALRTALSDIARRCIDDLERRHREIQERFLGQMRARLALLSAQQNAASKPEVETRKFKSELDSFMVPLQREFDARRGGFRNFLRKTMPAQIESRVQNASEVARKDIQKTMKGLRGAHWKTLQAAVRREGTFYGSKHINLPHDFALSFEEPVAEVWTRSLLADLRRETREFADYQSGAVTTVLKWAQAQGIHASGALLKALVESVEQHGQEVNAVGKEAVDDLRDKVRTQLINKIESPIRRKCRKFVDDHKDSGIGVKDRILDLFDQLADDVVSAASDPAIELLVLRFQEVEREILAAFGEHGDPLAEAAKKLVERKSFTIESDSGHTGEFAQMIENAILAIPPMDDEAKGLGAA